MTTTEPNETQSQTALDIWNVQTQALANPALADAAIEVVYQNLMGLHKKLMDSGSEKSAAKVEEAYNQALSIYHTTTQQRAVIDVGAAAISMTDEQRLQAVTDLQQLLKAIDDGDTNHPKLEGFAGQIQEDAEAYLEDAMWEGAHDNSVESLVETWGFDWSKASTVYDAILGNAGLSKRQEDLFRAFAASVDGEDPEDEEDPDEDGDE